MSQREESWSQEARVWLPNDAANRMFAELRYTPALGVMVHIPESRLPQLGPGAASQPVPVIHGETLGGWPFTLLDGRMLRPKVYTFENQHSAAAQFETLVRGGHVNEISEIVGSFARVNLRFLREFVRGGRTGYGLLSAAPEDEDVDFFKVTMPWGSLELYLSGKQSYSNSDTVSYHVTSHAQFYFDDEPSADTVEERIEPLRDLITLACRAPSEIQDLKLLSHAETTAADRHEFSVVRPPRFPAKENHSPSSLVLNAATTALGAELIPAWYLLRERLGSVWALFFSVLAEEALTPESQLLNLTSFAEGYHRVLHDEQPLSSEEAHAAREAMLAALPDDRHRAVYRGSLTYANSQSQRKRILWLTKTAAAVLPAWGIDVRLFSAQLTDTRNWLTHWGDRGRDVQEGDDLEALSNRLYVVLLVNLLLDLGLDANDARAQVMNSMGPLSLP